jgi:hypothetical protein
MFKTAPLTLLSEGTDHPDGPPSGDLTNSPSAADRIVTSCD